MKKETPPVPRSVPESPFQDSAYPSCPNSIRYGITIDERKGFDHLGLGHTFVPMQRPLSKRETGGGVIHLPKQVQEASPQLVTCNDPSGRMPLESVFHEIYEV